MKKIIEQIKAIWLERELVKYLVATDFKAIYKNKILGILWALLDPLMMMLVYILLVVIIFKRGGPQFPVLLFSALLAWKWFTYSLESSVNSITGRAKLIQAIYFPKVVLALSRVLIGLINFMFGLTVLLPLLFIFEAKFTLNLLWLPVLIIIQFVFTFGAALICAALGVYFRDLENILEFTLRMWFYLSPALYSIANRIPKKFIPLYMLNPFAALFESYKNVLVLGLSPSRYIIVVAFLGMVVFVIGVRIFVLKDSDFAKDV